MTASDLFALLPLLFGRRDCGNPIMLGAAVHRSHALALGLTLAGLTGAFFSIFFVPLRQVTALLVIDRYALFFMGLIVAASFVVALLGYGYLAGREGNREEFYVLILVATFGAMVLSASTHFASFFLGLEVLSVASSWRHFVLAQSRACGGGRYQVPGIGRRISRISSLRRLP